MPHFVHSTIVSNPKGEKQVGGHWGGPVKMVFEGGRLKKPSPFPSELAFFEDVTAGKYPIATKYGLTPRFYGSEEIKLSVPITQEMGMPNDDGSTPEFGSFTYLIMEDATYGFKMPCILDIKMGTRSWHEKCCVGEKISRHVEKDRLSSTSLYGFKIAAMRTKDIVTCADVDYPRNFAWHFRDDVSMTSALRKFFDCCPPEKRAETLRYYAERVRQVREFMLDFHYEFVNSSLLLVCDADPSSTKAPVLYMIDFAHMFPIDGINQGYIKGCDELIRFFEILDRYYSGSTPSDVPTPPLPSPPPASPPSN